MNPFALCVLAMLGLTVAACGGGGGSIASASTAPPPPVPSAAPAPSGTVTNTQYILTGQLPPTPALVSGTYDAIGVAATNGTGQSAFRTLKPGDLQIAVDASRAIYSVSFDPAVFPGLATSGATRGRMSYAVVAETPGYANGDASGTYGHTYETIATFSNGGTQRGTDGKGQFALGTLVDADGKKLDSATTGYVSHTGLSYVALGEWGDNRSGPYELPVVFAYGQRTPAAALPSSGTATYLSKAVLTVNPQNVDIELGVDFGRRSIRATVKVEYGDYTDNPTGIAQLTGSDKIASQGAFEIALVGSASGCCGQKTQPVPVTGTLGGAFFGPDASQIGGYFVLPGFQDGTVPTPGAFAAAKSGS